MPSRTTHILPTPHRSWLQSPCASNLHLFDTSMTAHPDSSTGCHTERTCTDAMKIPISISKLRNFKISNLGFRFNLYFKRMTRGKMHGQLRVVAHLDMRRQFERLERIIIWNLSLGHFPQNLCRQPPEGSAEHLQRVTVCTKGALKRRKPVHCIFSCLRSHRVCKALCFHPQGCKLTPNLANAVTALETCMTSTSHSPTQQYNK